MEKFRLEQDVSCSFNAITPYAQQTRIENTPPVCRSKVLWSIKKVLILNEPVQSISQ